MFTYKIYHNGRLLLVTKNAYNASKKIAYYSSKAVAEACSGVSLHRLYHGIYDLQGIKIVKEKA